MNHVGEMACKKAGVKTFKLRFLSLRIINYACTTSEKRGELGVICLSSEWTLTWQCYNDLPGFLPGWKSLIRVTVQCCVRCAEQTQRFYPACQGDGAERSVSSDEASRLQWAQCRPSVTLSAPRPPRRNGDYLQNQRQETNGRKRMIQNSLCCPTA